MSHERLSIDRVARAYRVPPWFVDPTSVPFPRYPRIAWLLIRIRWALTR